MRTPTHFVFACLASLAVACTPSPPKAAGARYNGIEVKPARPKTDFTLTTTDGTPFRFAEETRGRVALLFFGYTSCPDVCPVHMANIAEALDRLSPGERGRVRVIFVSTDPDRDTPDRLRSWLSHFDPTFVGLRGPIDEVHRIEQAYGLAPSVTAEPAPGDTAYSVGHAAQILAFTPDDSLRVFYPFGTRQQDWVKDLPRLVAIGGE